MPTLVKISSNTKQLFKVAIAATVILLLSQCANIIPPTGGERDTKSPQLKSIFLENKSIRFAEKKILLNFDEFLQLKEAQTQVVVSPPLKYPLEYLLKGKSLVVKINDTLEANTTYNINFGKAITDLTEGNIADMPNYVVSTGDFIDSLSVSGNVADAYTSENTADILVMLYKQNKDSLPLKKPPFYFDRTDDGGNFEITNVAAGKYKVFALLEKNNNYLFDTPDEEKIAFLDSLVEPGWKAPPIVDTTKKDTTTLKPTTLGKGVKVEAVKGLKLRLFSELKEKQALKKWTYVPQGKLQLIYNKPVTVLNYSVLSSIKSDAWQSVEYNLARDSVVYWLNDTLADSLTIAVWADTSTADTLSFSLKKEKNDKAAKGKLSAAKPATKTIPKWQIIAGNGGIMELNKGIVLIAPAPIKTADFTKVKLWAKSDSLKMIDFAVIADSLNQRKFTLKPKWKEKTTYKFEFSAGYAEDMIGRGNDTLRAEFTTRATKDYGSLKAKVNVPNEKPFFLLQLIDEKGNTVQEKPLVNGKVQRFVQLVAGNYNLRLIADENQNGKWDTGKYLTHNQPEKVYIHTGKIEVKANWDLELDWNVE